MKQYLNFADSGNCTRTEQAQYIFTEFVPTHRDNGSGGQIRRGTGKRQKSTACRTDRRCWSGKPTARGYHAPCLAGVVHFCGVRPDAPGQWGQKGQNITYFIVPFRDIHVFLHSQANKGTQMQEFVADLYRTLCYELHNRPHSWL